MEIFTRLAAVVLGLTTFFTLSKAMPVEADLNVHETQVNLYIEVSELC
jgi:hypothetical protein